MNKLGSELILTPTPIHDFLENYVNTEAIRCHMPGHKGTVPFDITEIAGADDLYRSNGIISRSEAVAANIFGSKKTFYSCGGSTLCIQAMIAAVKFYTGKSLIIASRYAHQSLLNACLLLDMEIDFVYPSEYLSANISEKTIEKEILQNEGQVAAVFVNSIDYYGGRANIPAISKICKKHNIMLLVDNAHGAYLALTDSHPIREGATMTADSAHKTLPVLTGGAYLHVGVNAPAPLNTRAKEFMSIFGTSSPSYLILNSLDCCNRYMRQKAEQIVTNIGEAELLKKRLTAFGYVLKESDPLRVTINARLYGYTDGNRFGITLRRHGIESEMTDINYVVLLLSVVTDIKKIIDLEKILCSIPHRTPFETVEIPMLHLKKATTFKEAAFGKSKLIEIENATGKVLAEVNTTCPPCIPIVMPGEIIDDEAIFVLQKYKVKKVRVLT